MTVKFLGRTILPLVAAGLLVVACNSTTTNNAGPPTAFAVLRLTTTGTPDPAFGSGGAGFVITDINTTLFDFAMAVAIQPDSKIIAGGSNGLGGQGTIALVRYTPNGTPDATFGTGGIVTTPTPGGWSGGTASAIAVQADNKIVVAALLFNAPTSTTGIAVLRYNTDGTLDTTGFAAPAGFVTATIGPGLAGDGCAMALQGTNIVVAGASTNGNLVLWRFDTNGNLDTTFGPVPNGSVTTNLGTNTSATSPALAFQSTGSIILVSGNGLDHVMARYSANGVLDTTFNPPGTATPGVVVTDAGGVDFANAVAVQSDDKIVVAGHANVNFTLNTSDISLIRYNPDGTLDTTTFGATTGMVTTDLSGRFDNAFSVALQADGKILVSGNTGSGGFSQAAVFRYNTDGTQDPAFGTNGVVIAPLFGPSNIASGNAVMLQSTLGIVVAGYD